MLCQVEELLSMMKVLAVLGGLLVAVVHLKATFVRPSTVSDLRL